MAPVSIYRQADSDRHTRCTPGIHRRPAAGLTKEVHTRFRHNKVVCSVCDDDDRNHHVAGPSKPTQHHAKTSSSRPPAVQRCKRLLETPKTCDKQSVPNTHWRRHDANPWANTSCLPASLPVHTDNWCKKDEACVSQERNRIQQMKDRDSYYRDRHERINSPRLYQNDLKQAERNDRAGKHKSQQNKPGTHQNKPGTYQNKPGTQLPEVSHQRTPLSKEEKYAEELRLARIGYNKQRKNCAVNNPILVCSRIPPMPTAPPRGSTDVNVIAQGEISKDGPTRKFTTGHEARLVHLQFHAKAKTEEEDILLQTKPHHVTIYPGAKDGADSRDELDVHVNGKSTSSHLLADPSTTDTVTKTLSSHAQFITEPSATGPTASTHALGLSPRPLDLTPPSSSPALVDITDTSSRPSVRSPLSDIINEDLFNINTKDKMPSRSVAPTFVAAAWLGNVKPRQTIISTTDTSDNKPRQAIIPNSDTANQPRKTLMPHFDTTNEPKKTIKPNTSSKSIIKNTDSTRLSPLKILPNISRRSTLDYAK